MKLFLVTTLFILAGSVWALQQQDLSAAPPNSLSAATPTPVTPKDTLPQNQKKAPPPKKTSEYYSLPIGLMIAGLVAAGLGLLPPWMSWVFLGLGLMIMILAILRSGRSSRRSYGTGIFAGIARAIGKASDGCLVVLLIGLALISVLIAALVLLGELSVWIGLGILGLGVLVLLFKFIVRLFRKKQS